MITTLIILLTLILPLQDSTITETLVKQMEMERYEAVISKDASVLRAMLADEFIYHQPTGERVSKERYEEQVAEGNPAILSAEFIELDIEIYGDMAITRGVVAVEAVLDGRELSAKLLFLNAWIWRDDRLQLAARQSAFWD